jgi:hypothetical protein
MPVSFNKNVPAFQLQSDTKARWINQFGRSAPIGVNVLPICNSGAMVTAMSSLL